MQLKNIQKVMRENSNGERKLARKEKAPFTAQPQDSCERKIEGNSNAIFWIFVNEFLLLFSSIVCWE
jgi:hypothetical protein